MKIRALPHQQSRMLALFLLLLVAVFIIAMIALPTLLLHRHYDQAIEQQLDLLARYSRIGHASPGLTKQIEVLRAKNARSFFLKNTAPALAASEVQGMVKAVIEGNGGKIISMQIPEHKDDGNYRKVKVSIFINAAVGATQKIFHTLETQQPYFLLDNISIRATAGKFTPRNTNGLGAEPEFVVQFDVAGYAMLEAN